MYKNLVQLTTKAERRWKFIASNTYIRKEESS